MAKSIKNIAKEFDLPVSELISLGIRYQLAPKKIAIYVGTLRGMSVVELAKLMDCTTNYLYVVLRETEDDLGKVFNSFIREVTELANGFEMDWNEEVLNLDIKDYYLPDGKPKPLHTLTKKQSLLIKQVQCSRNEDGSIDIEYKFYDKLNALSKRNPNHKNTGSKVV